MAARATLAIGAVAVAGLAALLLAGGGSKPARTGAPPAREAMMGTPAAAACNSDTPRPSR